jgi:hypothetical protein
MHTKSDISIVLLGAMEYGAMKSQTDLPGVELLEEAGTKPPLTFFFSF